MERKKITAAQEDLEAYNKALEEIQEIFKYRFLSPKRYEDFFKKHGLEILIPKVMGWTNICSICFEPIRGRKDVDLNHFDLRKCNKNKPEKTCYLLNKRCRDVSLNGRKCKDISKEKALDTWRGYLAQKKKDNVPGYTAGEIRARRLQFLENYLDRQEVRPGRVYCNDPTCENKAHNKKTIRRKAVRSKHRISLTPVYTPSNKNT